MVSRNMPYKFKKTVVNCVYFIYKIVGVFGTAGYIPIGLLRVLSGKKSYKNYSNRYGIFNKETKKRLKQGGYLWFHAVSVGESLSAVPLIEKFLDIGFNVLVSNVTETGREIITKKFGSRIENIHMPFDFEPIVSRTLDLIKPVGIVIIETEIWPCLSKESYKRNIPLILVNGRISNRAFPRYLRFRFIFSEVLPYFSALAMQSAKDLDYAAQIGAPKNKTLNTGNMKFDMPCLTPKHSELAARRKKLLIPADARVICFGSTHNGEDEYARDTFLKLREEYPRLFLILAPRHPDRTPSIETMLTKAGLKVSLISKIGKNNVNVMIVDTIGELLRMYEISEVSFVGGSLVPTGGHNILEPASLGKPVIFGHHMDNFLTSRELILNCGGGIQVANGDELTQSFRKLLQNKQYAMETGKAGQKMMRENQGAVEKNFNLIMELLETKNKL